MLNQLSKRLLEFDIDIIFDDSTKEFIAKKGTNLEYGARPLRRTIQQVVEDKLSEEMLKGNVVKGNKLTATVEDDEIKFIAR